MLGMVLREQSGLFDLPEQNLLMLETGYCTDSSLTGQVAHSLATVYRPNSAKHKDVAYIRNKCISMWLATSARQVTCNRVCYCFVFHKGGSALCCDFRLRSKICSGCPFPCKSSNSDIMGHLVTHTEFQMNFCPVPHFSVPWSYGSPKCSFWLTLLWLLLLPPQTLKGSSRIPYATEPRDDSFGNSSQTEPQIPFMLQQRNTTLTSAEALVKKQVVAKCLTWGWSYHHEGCRKVSNVGWTLT